VIQRVQMKTHKQSLISDFTVTLDAPVTAGNRVVFLVGNYASDLDGETFAEDLTQAGGTATIGTVTKDGVQSDGDVVYSTAFSVPITGSGTLSLNLEFNTGNQTVLAVMAEYSGIDNASPVVGYGGYTTYGASPFTTSVTSPTNGGLFLGVLGLIEGGDISIYEDAPYNLLFEEEHGATNHVGSFIERIPTEETTDTASWTLGHEVNWTALLVVYRAATGGEDVSYTPPAVATTVVLEERVAATESLALATADDLTEQVSWLLTQVALLTARVDALGERTNTLAGLFFGHALLGAAAGVTATATLTITSATATLGASSGGLFIGPATVEGAAALDATSDLAADAQTEAP
jgi:hypothetical protein